MLSELVSTELAFSGSLDQQPSLRWQGKLDRWWLETEQGLWQLTQSPELGFESETQTVSVTAHCWEQEASSLCLDNDIKVGESGEAALSITSFDFAQISQYVPETLKLEGEFSSHVTAKWSPEASPNVEASIQLPEGGVELLGEAPVQLGWNRMEVTASLKDDNLNAQWLLDFKDNGDISGQAVIPNVLQEDKTIDGNLTLTTFRLGFLAPLVGDFSKFDGQVSTDLSLKGPALHPEVYGEFLLEQLKLSGNVTPIDVDNGNIALTFAGYDANLDASIETPDGELTIKGDAGWEDLEQWHAKARVFAEQLLVDIPPMVKVKVEPDMTIDVSAKHAKVDGSIHLPWGRIVVEALPSSAVSVSKDQVILNADLQPVEGGTTVPFKVESNVNITIGEDFRLSAFGLEGNLVGQLMVAQDDRGPQVNGEINIENGSYSSFGQDLLIQEGKILMNGPVDQPYVAITAVRNPENTQDDVTAGIKVSGPADEPEITIFSEPAMPQANALSYLLSGQNIGAESDGNAMTTALIGLSLAKSGRVVGEIGEAFGVQDLQVDTAGSGDESQVTVSGYVFPGLQVKYGVGIFDPVSELTVRYRLLSNLYVEVVSGVDSAVDVLYQFDWN